MGVVSQLRQLNRDQRNAFLASFLGWTLDAFDFFILVFIVKAVAADFHASVSRVTFAILLTLAMRPIGALLFGLAADRWGRRIPLMLDIVFYSLVELLSGFAPSLNWLIFLRALYGIGMGGEWGVGASLAMESIPEASRGLFSGILQEGYVVGYLLAAILYYLVFPRLGWRWMFFLGASPAVLVLFIRFFVRESAAWARTRRRGVGPWQAVRRSWPLFLYVIVMMTAFNFMSHGTQDLYPTFLQSEWKLSPHAVGIIAVIYNVGALVGGILFGMLSERIGRRKAIVLAAVLGIPVIPLWVYAPSVALLAAGAFLMQFCVQGAWGVIPAHLTELSPDPIRGTFPGFTYQLGNLFAAATGTIQAAIAERLQGNYAIALASIAAAALIASAAITALGRERRGTTFGVAEEPAQRRAA